MKEKLNTGQIRMIHSNWKLMAIKLNTYTDIFHFFLLLTKSMAKPVAINVINYAHTHAERKRPILFEILQKK